MANTCVSTFGPTKTCATWSGWNDTYWRYIYDTSTSGSTTTATIWYAWSETATHGATPIKMELTDEQKAEQAAQAERERLERERLAKAQELVLAKAKALLNSVLTAEQQAEVAAHRYFTVISKASQRRYRVRVDGGPSRNIIEVDAQGKAVRRLCAHTYAKGVIGDDHFVVQKLMLEHAEDEVLKVANFS